MSCAAPLRTFPGLFPGGTCLHQPWRQGCTQGDAEGRMDRQTNGLICRERLIGAGEARAQAAAGKCFHVKGAGRMPGSAGDGRGSSIIWGLGLTLKPHSSSPSLLQVPRCTYPCQVRAQRVPKGCAGASRGSRALGSHKRGSVQAPAPHWEKNNNVGTDYFISSEKR